MKWKIKEMFETTNQKWCSPTFVYGRSLGATTPRAKALPAGMRVSRNAEQAPRMFGWLKTWDSISGGIRGPIGPISSTKAWQSHI